MVSVTDFMNEVGHFWDFMPRVEEVDRLVVIYEAMISLG